MNTPPLNTNGYDETHNKGNKKYGKYYGKNGIQSKYPLKFRWRVWNLAKKFLRQPGMEKQKMPQKETAKKESRTKVDLL